jgi:D-tyrosyl-tRNA(Tyr) deacylase
MRAVVQRVKEAYVTIEGKRHGEIGRGMLVLLGVQQGDTQDDVAHIYKKLLGLRIFEDEAGKMNCDISDAQGSILLISQFTLLGDCRKGNRPSFTDAMEPNMAKAYYKRMADMLACAGVPVSTGVFAAHMQVGLVNDGPVTILLDSRKVF